MSGNKKLTGLLIGCLALLLVVFYALTVYPRIMDMKDSADEATTAKNAAQAKLKEAESLDPKKIEAQLADLRSRVPSSLELPNLIIKLDALATTSELTWLQGTPEDITVRAAQGGATTTSAADQAPELLESYSLSISVEGNINNLIKFIYGMTDRSIGRVVVIDSLDLQYNSDTDPNFVEAALKLQIIGWVDGASIDSSGCIEDESKGVDCDFRNKTEVNN